MNELLQSVYNQPESWDCDKFHFRRGHFSIWIANGATFCAPEGKGRASFTLLDRWRWWRAYRWWCKNAPAAKLTGEE